MSLPAQILQIVTTYQAAQLGYLTNLTPVISTLNTKFKYFEKETGAIRRYRKPPIYLSGSEVRPVSLLRLTAYKNVSNHCLAIKRLTFQAHMTTRTSPSISVITWTILVRA